MSLSQKVTILIPNYKTPELTKLCLRLLRRHTDFRVAKVIVIDNDSKDSSLDYLRTLSWIKLIERKPAPDDDVYFSHSRALDLAMEQVDTPYVLSIHTDTLIKSSQWLDYLIERLEEKSNIAGVGSWKLEEKTKAEEFFKRIEYFCQSLFYKLIGKTDHALEGKDGNFYYLRSHCAIYRMDLIKTYGLRFSMGDGTAGRELHRALIEKGHDMLFLPSPVLGQFMSHINHATMVLNPALNTREKNRIKGLKRIQKVLDEFNASAVLKNTQMDL